MNDQASLLFVSIHGAFITFDPNAALANKAESASNTKDTVKKGVCGKCTICKCKRSFGA